MVDFATDWCHWCKKLDTDVYTNPKVIATAAKLVAVKVDGDKETQLVRKYAVEGYPTILFINADGQEVQRIVGYVEPEEFIAQTKAALDKAG